MGKRRRHPGKAIPAVWETVNRYQFLVNVGAHLKRAADCTKEEVYSRQKWEPKAKYKNAPERALLTLRTMN